MYDKETLKKIIPYFVKLAVILLFCGLSYIAIKKVIEFAESQPKVVTELNGIAIGEKVSDVLFKNTGFKSMGWLGEEYKEKYENSFETHIHTSFFAPNGKVTEVAITCGSKDTTYEVSKIRCNAKGEDILARYGEDVKVLCWIKNDEYKYTHRSYDVEKYGISFGLFNNKVRNFEIAERNSLYQLDKKKFYGECD